MNNINYSAAGNSYHSTSGLYPPLIPAPFSSIALESPVQIPNAQPKIPTTRIKMIHLIGVQPFLINAYRPKVISNGINLGRTPSIKPCTLIAGSAIAIRTVAVSYTHLDVYKRQVFPFGTPATNSSIVYVL